MKTKFIKVTFVAAIAMVSAINVFKANESEDLSELALENVEALAIYEGDDNVKLPCIRNDDDYCTYSGISFGRKTNSQGVRSSKL